MSTRTCYIHVGPHKTGTSAIQWFLQENRAELLKHDFFVPESVARHGAHHALVRRLCGQEMADPQQPAADKFIRALMETKAKAIVISSEALEGLLIMPDYATIFFNRIKQLDLQPKLVLFPRNQPQWINSSYSSGVQTFRRASDSFQDFVLAVTQRLRGKLLPWVELAESHGAELIARPFTRETLVRGVVPEFLRAIGIDSSQFRGADIRQNEAAGPFTVALARGVTRSICGSGKRLKWLQAIRCKSELARYLKKNGLADSGYCGLTTALARKIEATYRRDNDAFAQRVWGASWEKIFAADVGREFAPNDFDLREPDESTQRLLARAMRDMTAVAEKIMLDPALAVDAPWNDLHRRGGWTPARTQTVSAEPRPHAASSSLTPWKYKCLAWVFQPSAALLSLAGALQEQPLLS